MRINELFYSLQGEGRWAGTPAVFLRLAGCNLRCPFCDTRHESYEERDEDDVVREAALYAARHIVITGGEPTLQLTASLARKLHAEGFYIHLETNGSIPLPEDCPVDWVTCSPKTLPVRLTHIDELKVVYEAGQDLAPVAHLRARVYSLQPMAVASARRSEENLRAAVAYCLAHPRWSLSLQTHKLIGVR